MYTLGIGIAVLGMSYNMGGTYFNSMYILWNGIDFHIISFLFWVVPILFKIVLFLSVAKFEREYESKLLLYVKNVLAAHSYR